MPQIPKIAKQYYLQNFYHIIYKVSKDDKGISPKNKHCNCKNMKHQAETIIGLLWSYKL